MYPEAAAFRPAVHTVMLRAAANAACAAFTRDHRARLEDVNRRWFDLAIDVGALDLRAAREKVRITHQRFFAFFVGLAFFAVGGAGFFSAAAFAARASFTFAVTAATSTP